MSQTATRFRETVVHRALKGPGSSRSERPPAAFENQGVTRRRAPSSTRSRSAHGLLPMQMSRREGGGVSEDEIFELTVCAASVRRPGNWTPHLRRWMRRPAPSPPTEQSEGVTR